MSIIEQLRSFEYFTAAEKAIIKVIFQKPDFLKTATASELAKTAYTSASTVARLCQKLGCKNYNDFRIKFVAEAEKRQYESAFIDASIPFRKEDSPEDVFRQLAKLQSTAITETLALALNEMEHYRHAIEMLDAADCVHIFGMGMNLHLAYDFVYKMARIHRPVHISLDHQEQMLASATLPENHCAIVISYSGETPDTLLYAQRLKKNGTPVISITSLGENSVTRYADERLYIATMEKQFSKIGPFSSCASIMAILNYLYAGIFSLNYDYNYQLLLSTVLSVTEFRSQAAPLKEER